MNRLSLTDAIIICGPTTTGKTEVASHIARKLHGALINTDKYQLYASKDIHLGVGLDKDEPPSDVPCYLFGALSTDRADTSPENLVDLQIDSAHKAIAEGYTPIFVGCSSSLNRILIERRLTERAFILIWKRDSDLLERCRSRVENMLNEGLIQETKNVVKKGLDTHWVVDNNVVYKAVISWIENDGHDRHRLIEEISHGIVTVALEQERKYRQLSNVEWLPVSNAADATVKILHEIVTK